MARRDRSRYTILACLSVRPMSGYDVKQFLDGTIAHFWHESYGQIYPTLRALEADGMIEGRDDAGDARGRRVYTLTDAGLAALRSWLAEPPEPDVPRYEMSLKLFFADQLPVEVTLAHLATHRALHAAMREAYRTRELELRDELAGSPHLPYWLAVLRGGIHYAEMVVAWCDETVATLKRLDPGAYPADPQAPIRPG